MAARASAQGLFVDQDQTSEAERFLQKQKLEELVGLLLSAGYFRARIATLTPFDKVGVASSPVLSRRGGSRCAGECARMCGVAASWSCGL
jgi:hypothetical protein